MHQKHTLQYPIPRMVASGRHGGKTSGGTWGTFTAGARMVVSSRIHQTSFSGTYVWIRMRVHMRIHTARTAGQDSRPQHQQYTPL